MKASMLVALAVAAGPSLAGLGGRPMSAGETTARALASPSGATYRQETSVLDSGTTVHQFIGADGTVFAVAWSGPFLPDLRALLGAHFTALQQTEGGERTRSSALSISRPNLVLVSTGHMGAFQGRAWLPNRLPAGFDPRSMP